ncbi:phosphotransferase family protein [Amycolatopsis circi]|uniref:phosphotransferase family protein n=1 Tax=Amycolatopsis circi TaxID=871959 RepID=UPI003CC54BFE
MIIGHRAVTPSTTRPHATNQLVRTYGSVSGTHRPGLSEHRHSSPAELGAALHALHRLPLPAQLALPSYDAFSGIGERIAHARHLDPDDRRWLTDRLAQLRRAVDALDLHRTTRVLHGDAWQGNLVVPLTGGDPVLLDLDHVSLGHPAWDLVPLAADHARLRPHHRHRLPLVRRRLRRPRHHRHAALPHTRRRRGTALGRLRARQNTSPEAHQEAQHRITCLREVVPRPWTWTWTAF